MTIRLQDAKTFIEDGIGDDPSLLTTTILVNLAGKLLFASNEWNFLRKAPVGIDFVASQSFVLLPDDVGRVSQITPARDIEITQVSIETLLRRRVVGSSSDGSYVYAYCFEDDSGGASTDTDNPITMRLELEPTPSANKTDALYVSYYRKWTDLSADLDRVRIPTDLEPLFWEALRVVRKGYDEDDVMDVSQLQSMLEGGAIYQRALRYDAQIETNAGPMEGGIGQVGHLPAYPDNNPTIRITTP